MWFNKFLSKIPSWILYGIVAFLTIYDFSFTYFFVKYHPVAREGNPLHAFFIKTFGLEYLLFVIPIGLFILYATVKLVGGFISRRNKEIPGEKHMALILILGLFPNVFNEICRTLLGFFCFVIPKKMSIFDFSNPLGLITSILIIADLVWLIIQLEKKPKI
jgi:hypothetical protein